MESQHLMNEGPLLDERGNIIEPGYAYTLVKKYDRNAIKAKKSRIKEWDYYYVGNSSYGVALTIADNGYMAMASISFLDFEAKYEDTVSKIGWFPMGKLGLPSTSTEGDTVYEGKGFSMKFLHEGKKRRLICQMPSFKGKDFHCDLLLEETIDGSMVIATPFKKDAHFYYNQKINCLRASGYAKVGDRLLDFNKDSYGVLDWGRGVWTYKNTWFWSSASFEQDGHIIGWNLGYGFGSNKAATENMLFYDGKAYKINDVRMDIPLKRSGGDDFMSKWTFRSPTGEVAMEFFPILDRHADTNLLILRSNQHQVFGRFKGYIVIEGKTIDINDALGFAEKVYNKW